MIFVDTIPNIKYASQKGLTLFVHLLKYNKQRNNVKNNQYGNLLELDGI